MSSGATDPAEYGCVPWSKLAQEAVGAGNAVIAPLQGLLRWRGKHGEQAHRVGTVFVDSGLGIHTVVFRLRHLGDTAAVNFVAGGGFSGLYRATLFIPLDSNIQW